MSWIDSQISEGMEILDSKDVGRAKHFVKETCGLLMGEDVPSPKAGLKSYGQRVAYFGANGWSGTTFTQQDYLDDVLTLIKKLRQLKERRAANGEVSEATHVFHIDNSSTSTASASVSLDISLLFEAEDAIRHDDSVDDEVRAEMVSLLREVISAAQRQEASTVADRLRQLLEDGANAVTLMTWLGPILVQVGMMLANGS